MPGTFSDRWPSTRAGEALLRKLKLHSSLTEEQERALQALPSATVEARPRTQPLHQGDHTGSSCLVVDGVVARYKLLPDGERQILSFHFSGDIVDLGSLHLERSDCSAVAIGQARLAYLPHEALRDVMSRHARVALALWRETQIDAAIAREWLLNVGRRSAYAKLAHLFCELAVRMEQVGLCQTGCYRLAATQIDLADATGMTSVHVNRTLQSLRGDGLISTQGSELRIMDWNALADAGSFDPAYLNLTA
jgi:CRP-like cAMP-binding protein